LPAETGFISPDIAGQQALATPSRRFASRMTDVRIPREKEELYQTTAVLDN
jgi:hypothetical protein